MSIQHYAGGCSQADSSSAQISFASVSVPIYNSEVRCLLGKRFG